MLEVLQLQKRVTSEKEKEPIIANISMALPVRKETTVRDLEILQSKLNQWRLSNLLLR